MYGFQKSHFATHLLVSVLFLCLERLHMGNPELAPPAPRESSEIGLGAALIHMELMIASYHITYFGRHVQQRI